MLKVYAVCVNGVGSSLLLKMTVEKYYDAGAGKDHWREGGDDPDYNHQFSGRKGAERQNQQGSGAKRIKERVK